MKEIPAQFSNKEILSNAYSAGWNHGHGIACHNVPNAVNGDVIWTDTLGRVAIDPYNVRDVHQALCFEAESNSRDFSPFEFTAHEFNSLGDDGEVSSSEAWEAFEAGVSDAIFADLATYTDEDYGILENENDSDSE